MKKLIVIACIVLVIASLANAAEEKVKKKKKAKKVKNVQADAAEKPQAQQPNYDYGDAYDDAYDYDEENGNPAPSKSNPSALTSKKKCL